MSEQQLQEIKKELSKMKKSELMELAEKYMIAKIKRNARANKHYRKNKNKGAGDARRI